MSFFIEWPELFGPTSLSTRSNHNNFLAISYLNARSIVNKLSILENYIVNNIHAKTDFFSPKHGSATQHLILCIVFWGTIVYVMIVYLDGKF